MRFLFILIPFLLSLVLLQIEERLLVGRHWLTSSKQLITWHFASGLAIMASGAIVRPPPNNLFIEKLKTKNAPTFTTSKKPSFMQDLKARIRLYGEGDSNVMLLLNETVRHSYLSFGDWGLRTYVNPVVTTQTDAYAMLAVPMLTFYISAIMLIVMTSTASTEMQLLLIILAGTCFCEVVVLTGNHDLLFPEYQILSWLFFQDMATPYERIVIMRYAFAGFAAIVSGIFWRKRDNRIRALSWSLGMIKVCQDKVIEELFGGDQAKKTTTTPTMADAFATVPSHNARITRKKKITTDT